MACRPYGAKPVSEPMLGYCQLDPWEQISVKFESEFYHFHSRKCIWKCRPPQWRPFCPGGAELNFMRVSRESCWQLIWQPRMLEHHMLTSTNGNISALLAICARNSPVTGEFPGEFPTQRPVSRSFDVFFYLRLNKRLSKQWYGWWFEAPPRPLWRQCNDPSKYIFWVLANTYRNVFFGICSCGIWTLSPMECCPYVQKRLPQRRIDRNKMIFSNSRANAHYEPNAFRYLLDIHMKNNSALSQQSIL